MDNKTPISSDMIISLQEMVETYQSLFLSVYDEIFFTTLNGTILYKAGKIENLWETGETEIIGNNLFELGDSAFIENEPLENILKLSKTCLVRTSRRDQQLLITAYRLEITNHRQVVVWGIKTLLGQPLDNCSKKKIRPHTTRFPASFIVRSRKMLDILTTVKMVSQVPVTILLLGESGVGKELIAKTIHQMGHRKDKPFIAVNCGAIPVNLLESELFGYEDGAFTGAKKGGKAGQFILANGGILFLDEVAELPLNLQVKLLRVLQEREVTPLGGSNPVKVDIQLIAATNQSLKQMVKEGKFREDLYYRLSVVPIKVPALRERIEDIPDLIYHFIEKYNQMYQRRISIAPDAVDLLSIYHWPGNVRQLENAIERLVVTSREARIDAPLIQRFMPHEKKEEESFVKQIMPLHEAVERVEEQLINMAMEQYRSVGLAAKALNISQPTMSRKYNKIRQKARQSDSIFNKRKIIEEQLDKQLRSLAIATAVVIQPEEVIALENNTSISNANYRSLQKKMTIIKREVGIIEWVYIFKFLDNQRMRHIVGDENFVIQKPGDIYNGPPKFMDVVIGAMEGNVRVTPLYKDIYGEWKTSLAPILDDNKQVIALIGYDFSRAYIDSEFKRLGRLFQD